MANILWRMDAGTHERWQYLRDKLVWLDEHDEEAYVLREEVRSLPGFPVHYDLENDTIVPELVQTSYSMLRGIRS